MKRTVSPTVVPLSIDPTATLLQNPRDLGWEIGRAHPTLFAPELRPGCFAFGLTKVIGPKDERQFLRGPDLFERAYEIKALSGQCQAEAMFKERAVLLRPWKKKGCIIVCPREVWIDKNGHPRVSALCCTGRDWVFEFLLYENAWCHEYLLVLLDGQPMVDTVDKSRDAAVSLSLR